MKNDTHINWSLLVKDVMDIGVYTQHTLAQELHTTQYSISNWYLNKSKPNKRCAESLLALAKDLPIKMSKYTYNGRDA